MPCCLPAAWAEQSPSVPGREQLRAVRRLRFVPGEGTWCARYGKGGVCSAGHHGLCAQSRELPGLAPKARDTTALRAKAASSPRLGTAPLGLVPSGSFQPAPRSQAGISRVSGVTAFPSVCHPCLSGAPFRHQAQSNKLLLCEQAELGTAPETESKARQFSRNNAGEKGGTHKTSNPQKTLK